MSDQTKDNKAMMSSDAAATAASDSKLPPSIPNAHKKVNSISTTNATAVAAAAQPKRKLQRIDWDEYYKLLLAYQKEHNNLHVPTNYETPNGIKLGKWAKNQRASYKRVMDGKAEPRYYTISEERIDRLNELGFAWDAYDRAWEDHFEMLKEYKEKNNDLRIPAAYQTNNGVKVGFWAAQQRSSYKRVMEGNTETRSYTISQEHIDRLTDIGFPWNLREMDWPDYYELLIEFKARYLHTRVPRQYKTDVDGVKLGIWTMNQRKRLKPHLDENGNVKDGTDIVIRDRIELLNEISFSWGPTRGDKVVEESSSSSSSSGDKAEKVVVVKPPPAKKLKTCGGSSSSTSIMHRPVAKKKKESSRTTAENTYATASSSFAADYYRDDAAAEDERVVDILI